jgi:hypothetical protein
MLVPGNGQQRSWFGLVEQIVWKQEKRARRPRATRELAEERLVFGTVRNGNFIEINRCYKHSEPTNWALFGIESLVATNADWFARGSCLRKSALEQEADEGEEGEQGSRDGDGRSRSALELEGSVLRVVDALAGGLSPGGGRRTLAISARPLLSRDA